MTTLPAVISSLLPSVRQPEHYALAKQYLAECCRIDEAAEIADRMLAIATYARQSEDSELCDNAQRIRLRATHRMGELLIEYDGRGGDRSKGAGDHNSAPDEARISRFAVAKEAGLSPHQVRVAVGLAKIEPRVFNMIVEQSPAPGSDTIRRLSLVQTVEEQPARPCKVRVLSETEMEDLAHKVRLRKVVHTLLDLRRLADQCGGDIAGVVEILIVSENEEQTARVVAGLGFAAKLKAALDRRGMKPTRLRSV